MPSGFTHILLAKTFNERSNHLNDELEVLLLEKLDYFQLGAIGPDLPYSQIPMIQNKDEEVADDFHWHNTNQVALKCLEDIKAMTEGYEKRECFAFVLGFISHIVADGIIHPFVRDKVGPYKENDNATKHRLLEMRLDVLLADEINYGEINCTKLQDELKNPLSNFDHVADIFSKNIKSVYAKNISSGQVKTWVKTMEGLFETAANSCNQYYSFIPGLNGFLYKDLRELKATALDDLILKKHEAKGRKINFRDKETHFYNDCLPRFYEVMSKIAIKAHSFVFQNGTFGEVDLPAINLDTGRSLSDGMDGYNLDSPAIYWSL